MCNNRELDSHGEHHDHEEGHPHSGIVDHDHQHAHPHGCDEGHEHAHEHDHEHEHSHSHPHSDDHDHGSDHTHPEEHAHEHTHKHAHPHPHVHEHAHPHEGEAHGHEHPHSHDHEGGHCGNHGVNGAGCCQGGDVENKDIEILGLLLDHWVAHNQDHAKEYNTWVEKMNRLGKNDVAEALIEAVALMSEADKHLVEAKKELN